MKDTLLEIDQKLGNTRPIFVGTINGGELELVPRESYDPLSAELDHQDPVVELMVTNYREAFDKNKRRFVKYSPIDGTVADMRNQLIQIFILASPLKNPQQSKLYKWFVQSCRMDTLTRREGLIALYRYACANTNDSFRFSGGSDNVHAKNFIAIVEKMREKYERQQ